MNLITCSSEKYCSLLEMRCDKCKYLICRLRYLATCHNAKDNNNTICIFFLLLQDKMDGFVSTHFFGWWLKVN